MNRLRLSSLFTGLLVFSLLVCSPWRQSVQAAPPAQEDNPPDSVIYIVQAGDTLFSIAQQFGITVDILAAANGIQDPALITIGQRLIIPPPPEPARISTIHTVQPGETLHTLELSYNLPLLEIAKTNQIIRADRVYVGQTLTFFGQKEPSSLLRGQSYSVQAGDSLVELAAQFNISPWMLSSANRLKSPYVRPPHAQMWIPGEEGRFLDFAKPFAGLSMHPLPAAQGLTLSMQISLTAPISLTGTWLNLPITFYAGDKGSVALMGIPTLTEPGIYTMIITAANEAGQVTHFVQNVPVVSGDFAFEEITVSDDIAAAMTAEAVQNETDLLTQVFSTRTPTAMWDGYFALPASGDVTSVFGTHRSYNIPNASAYHTGTDFGTLEGAALYAPAAGIVVFSQPLLVRGNVIIIDHGWGVMTGYWHLLESLVNKDDYVAQGQHIAYTGNTGLSTGPHLHWEMQVNNIPVSGLQWVWELFP